MVKNCVAFFYVLMLACVSQLASAGDYSVGYRLGMLTKYSVSGIVNKSGEGEINLGREGTPLFSTDKDGHRSYTNPWAFSSTDLSKFNDKFMNQFAGEYVVVEYRQDFMNLGISQKTGYNITNIARIDQNNKPVSCVDPAAEKSGSKSDGFRVGRIVKASTKGVASKSFEVMIQQGNAGNQYFPLSALSREMYECAVKNLKSAKPVKVFYSKAWINMNFLSQDSNYAIWKIETMGDI
jgi:hypothetical protein